MVYGKRAIFPSHVELPALQLLKCYEMNDTDPLQVRMFYLIYLNELRENLYREIQKRNSVVKKWFDKRYAYNVSLKLGHLVLKWDEDRTKPGHHRKFDSLWFRTYHIIKEI